jgi:hypothetical protein
MGNGYHSSKPTFEEACAEFVGEIKEFGSTVGSSFEDDPVREVDRLISVNNEVVVRKIYDDERARYEVISRRKKTGLTDQQLNNLETVFPSLAPDDVVMWRMRPGSQGELVYAGVAFYGESDIATRTPLYEPKAPKEKVVKLGEPRKLR